MNTKQTLQDIPIDQIKPDPNQPRKIFDEDALADLAGSIREHGVLQPIGVYKNGSGYVIKHGERRWRACKLAGLAAIPAIIGDTPDALTTRLRQFVENDQREHLNVIEAALFYRSMLEEEGLSKNELARRLGRGGHTTFINSALIWLELEDEIQAAVAAKRLPKDARVAKALLEVPDTAARVKLGVALAGRRAGIDACITAAGDVTKKLQQAPKGSNITAPSIALSLSGRVGSLPSSQKIGWQDMRESAQAMCKKCSLKGIVKHPEPAWALVLEVAEKTCGKCIAQNGRDLQVCRECPGVAIIRQLAGVADD